ncbi:MAG: hypothetical protein HWD61_08755 [Parachlamydiaceae bacterium]|nr:MAG: hypothetical protein HWD61_08755 [Parachlamydiaceae bacterium]
MFLKGIQLRLAFLQIPAKIRRLQLNRQTELVKRLEKRGAKLAKAQRKEQKLTEKVNGWYGPKGTITYLENQIKEAGMKDFTWTNRLEKTMRIEKIDIPRTLVEK